MGRHAIVPPPLPDYTKELPGNAMFKSSEVAKMFGYKTTDSFVTAVGNGHFPPADKVAGSTGTGGWKRSIRAPKLYWKLSTLRKEHARRTTKEV